MSCLYPRQGWRSKSLNENGKRPIVFDRKSGFVDMPVDVPCGKCVKCRLKKSAEWAMRCMHEASLHDSNYFLTLTYDEDHYPLNGSLVRDEIPKFIKRLRRRLDYLGKPKIRVYYCGEYGDSTNRPHYHAIVFGLRLDDLEFYKASPNGDRYYNSAFIDSVWGLGYVVCGGR